MFSLRQAVQLRRVAGAVALLTVAGLICAPGFAQESSPGEFRISIGTGSPTGIYFAAGNAICRLVQRHNLKLGFSLPKLSMDCAAPATPGSIYNIAQVRDRNFTFALAQSDWQFHAFRGTGRYTDQKFDQLRSVFSLHPEAFQILAGRGTGISSFRGLKGKRVAIGQKGSGARGTFDVLLQAQGVDASYFSRADELEQAAQNKELCDGNVDAISYVIGIPSGLVREALTKCGASLVSLDDERTGKLIASNPYYATTRIRTSTYPGMEADAVTFAVMATLVTRADTPDEVVYELVRAVFENLDELRAMHPAFAHLEPRAMVHSGTSAPIHPGALRYYQTMGWTGPRGS